MADGDYGEWQPMETAPRDGTKVLVALHSSEQGPAEVDVARWAQPSHAEEPSWIASDSDPAAPVIYSDSDLAFWMPLPTVVPAVRSGRLRADKQPPEKPSDLYEMDGSSI